MMSRYQSRALAARVMLASDFWVAEDDLDLSLGFAMVLFTPNSRRKTSVMIWFWPIGMGGVGMGHHKAAKKWSWGFMSNQPVTLGFLVWKDRIRVEGNPVSGLLHIFPQVSRAAFALPAFVGEHWIWVAGMEKRRCPRTRGCRVATPVFRLMASDSISKITAARTDRMSMGFAFRLCFKVPRPDFCARGTVCFCFAPTCVRFSGSEYKSVPTVWLVPNCKQRSRAGWSGSAVRTDTAHHGR